MIPGTAIATQGIGRDTLERYDDERFGWHEKNLWIERASVAFTQGSRRGSAGSILTDPRDALDEPWGDEPFFSDRQALFSGRGNSSAPMRLARGSTHSIDSEGIRAISGVCEPARC